MKNNNVKYMGNYFGFTGKNYDGWTISKKGISFPILASCCNGNVPKVFIKVKDNDESCNNRNVL